MPDIGAALTRKLGPLPAWAWGAVVGGAVLGTRMLRGGSPGASSGLVRSVGGDGASYDFDGSPTGQGPGGGSATPTTPIDIPGVYGAFGAAFALQQQVSEALRDLSTAQRDRNYANDQIEVARRRYFDGAISATERDSLISRYESDRDAAGGRITAANTRIDSLQQQLTAIFAAPAA